jgi:NADPH:quinone reductase-like Zn-dependent oxidoreductase
MKAVYLSSIEDLKNDQESPKNDRAGEKVIAGQSAIAGQSGERPNKADDTDPLANLTVGELPEPLVPPGWALVKMEAASLNHHDLWTLQGVSSRPVSPPQVLGCDGAGRVVAYGHYGQEEVPSSAPPIGTEVVAYPVISCGTCLACRSGNELLCHDMALLSEGNYQGTLAELFVVPIANLIALPEGVSPVAAASLSTTYLTAYHMLYGRARLSPGDTILVNGATGGVAVAAIQLAALGSIRVIATARTPEKRDYALRMGAIAAFESSVESAREIQRYTSGGVDAVIETVGAPTWELSLRSVKPDGVVVISGATGGGNPPAMLQRIFWRQIRIAGSTMGTYQELRTLVNLAAADWLHPQVDSVTPLGDARSAFERLYRGEQAGKLIIIP